MGVRRCGDGDGVDAGERQRFGQGGAGHGHLEHGGPLRPSCRGPVPPGLAPRSRRGAGRGHGCSTRTRFPRRPHRAAGWRVRDGAHDAGPAAPRPGPGGRPRPRRVRRRRGPEAWSASENTSTPTGQRTPMAREGAEVADEVELARPGQLPVVQGGVDQVVLGMRGARRRAGWRARGRPAGRAARRRWCRCGRSARCRCSARRWGGRPGAPPPMPWPGRGPSTTPAIPGGRAARAAAARSHRAAKASAASSTAPRPAQDLGGVERPGPQGLGHGQQVVLAVAEDVEGVDVDQAAHRRRRRRASTTTPGRPRPRRGRGRRAWCASRRRCGPRVGPGRSRGPTARWRRNRRGRRRQPFAEARVARRWCPSTARASPVRGSSRGPAVSRSRPGRRRGRWGSGRR